MAFDNALGTVVDKEEGAVKSIHGNEGTMPNRG